MKPQFAAGLLVLLILLDHPAMAHKLFMPGDAFFHAILDKEFCEELDGDSTSLKLYYIPPERFGLTFSGYAGFDCFVIEDVDPALKSALCDLYREWRLERPRVIKEFNTIDGVAPLEMNGLHLLIYNKEFDPEGTPIGLKYNENWMNPPEPPSNAKGDYLPAQWYESFVPGEQAVINDWMIGPKVDGLKVRIPEGVDWSRLRPRPLEEMIHAKVEKLRFFVIPHGRIKAVHDERNNTVFWEISPEGVIKEYVWKDYGDLVLQDEEKRIFNSIEQTKD